MQAMPRPAYLRMPSSSTKRARLCCLPVATRWYVRHAIVVCDGGVLLTVLLSSPGFGRASGVPSAWDWACAYTVMLLCHSIIAYGETAKGPEMQSSASLAGNVAWLRAKRRSLTDIYCQHMHTYAWRRFIVVVEKRAISPTVCSRGDMRRVTSAGNCNYAARAYVIRV